MALAQTLQKINSFNYFGLDHGYAVIVANTDVDAKHYLQNKQTWHLKIK